MYTVRQPLVSVVTPVYNEAGYLAECIESVLAQTYQNWDYTIIDNCSTDRSLEVARRYAAKERRIRIHENQQFLPAIPNHNVALRQISPKSKYCKVVLGDDWIFPNCLERMVAVAEEHPSVGLVGAYVLEGEATAEIDGVRHHISAGDLMFFPAGVFHDIQVISERIKLLVIYSPPYGEAREKVVLKEGANAH